MALDYKRLYYTTDELLSRFKPSLSNYFDVFIDATFGGINTDADGAPINFSAYDAVLPGTSYETTEVFGVHQGLTQTYANKRVYPPVDVSFYIDSNYTLLRFFETWMGKISPNLGIPYNSYQKFEYPGTNGGTVNGYKREVIITKFERDFREPSSRVINPPEVKNLSKTTCTYTLRNAYPTNVISVPVSYDGANILRTTVTFNYDVYSFAKDNLPYNEPGGGAPPAQPGADTLAGLTQQSQQLNTGRLNTTGQAGAQLPLPTNVG
jgi:hypothetical protein